MAVSYVGPYSPAVYNAANKMQAGGSGVPYAPAIISAAQKVINSQPRSSSGGSAPAPQQQASSGEAPQQQAQGFNPPDYDSLIRPAIDGYNSYISTLEGQHSGNIKGIDADLVNKKDAANQSFNTQTNTIGRAKVDQADEQESAADEARRLYGEIQQGLQARYGKTTGTGAFTTELAGRQTAQDISNIRTTGAKLIRDLDDKLLQVQEISRLTLQDLDTQAESQKRQVKNQLDQQVAEIRSKIGETQMRKAELYANAYESYQNYVRQVDANNTSFKQQLYLQQKAAEQTLETAKARASAVGSSAKPVSLKYITQTDGLGKQTTYGVDPYTGEIKATVGGSGGLGGGYNGLPADDTENPTGFINEE